MGRLGLAEDAPAHGQAQCTVLFWTVSRDLRRFSGPARSRRSRDLGAAIEQVHSELKPPQK